MSLVAVILSIMFFALVRHDGPVQKQLPYE
jgi:hypothetical protein